VNYSSLLDALHEARAGVDCPDCGGTGEVAWSPYVDGVAFSECETCAGKGSVFPNDIDAVDREIAELTKCEMEEWK
jgi:DnaJ-class molecular chaperone